jgi:hypothetical protein
MSVGESKLQGWLQLKWRLRLVSMHLHESLPQLLQFHEQWVM